MRSDQKFILSIFINTVGSALTWTGLPNYIARVTGDLSHSGDLFFISNICSLSVILFGGLVADNLSKKKFCVYSSFLNAFLSIALILPIHLLALKVFYIGLFIFFAISAMLEVVEMQWFMSQIRLSENFESKLGTRFGAVAIAKVAGMAMGPLVYSFFGEWALFFDGLSFLAAAYFLRGLPHEDRIIRTDRSKLRVFDSFLGVSYFLSSQRGLLTLAVGVACGIFAFPMVHLYQFQVNFISGINSRIGSIFWLIGGLGYAAAGFLVKPILERCPDKKYYAVVAGIFLAVLLSLNVFFKDSLIVVMSCFSIGTLLNPGFLVIMNSKVYKEAPSDLKGRVSATFALSIQIGVLLGLLALNGINSSQIQIAFSSAVFLVLLRSIFIYRLL